jgi:hypothetical protein
MTMAFRASSYPAFVNALHVGPWPCRAAVARRFAVGHFWRAYPGHFSIVPKIREEINQNRRAHGIARNSETLLRRIALLYGLARDHSSRTQGTS